MTDMTADDKDQDKTLNMLIMTGDFSQAKRDFILGFLIARCPKDAEDALATLATMEMD